MCVICGWERELNTLYAVEVLTNCSTKVKRWITKCLGFNLGNCVFVQVSGSKQSKKTLPEKDNLDKDVVNAANFRRHDKALPRIEVPFQKSFEELLFPPTPSHRLQAGYV
jgi:hypothetical protein